MADVTWTEEQLAAITARNPGILVSAGAGSGKTAVLTERVVQRIFDPVDPVDADRMLIVTFTRAAAEEMRERIAVKLRAVQREHPEDSSVARQLILLEKADISTVHAFCQRIVKENFQLLDIQSGFRIADEKELEVWRTEAAGEILEEEYAAGEGSFLSLVELLSEERSDRRVTDTLLRLYDFVRAHPFYEAWLEQALERYRSEAPIGETDWGKLLFADALSGARQALEAMEEARDLLDGDEKIGARIVQKALEAPLFHIVTNAGLEGAVVINKVKESKVGVGFDAYNEEYVDMIQAGILDPVKVTRSALQNATSVSATLLTTESVVSTIKEPAPAMPAGADGGMGMM